MRHKFILLIITTAFMITIYGCAESDKQNASDTNTPQNTETETIETSNLQESEAEQEDIIIFEIFEIFEISEISQVLETSAPPDTVLTETLSENVKESESITDKPFKYTVSEDLTDADLTTLSLHKKIALMVEKADIDISRLSELDSLEELQIYQGRYPGILGDNNSYISDFSFLNGMNLKILKLDCGDFDIKLNEIKLQNLEEIELYYANILDEEDLKSFPNLKNLTVWFSHIASIDPFCCLLLEDIDLYACGFTKKSFDKINEIKSLEILTLRFCDSLDIKTLNGLTNLKKFYLSGGEIGYDIELIYELTWLERLGIAYTFITDEQERRYRELNPECSFTISYAIG